MDLSFVLDGVTIHLTQVKMEDIPSAVSMMKQSFREPPLFESDGLKGLRSISTEELYERLLMIAEHVPNEEVTDLTTLSTKTFEQAYLYRAEMSRRNIPTGFIQSFEMFIERFKCFECGRGIHPDRDFSVNGHFLCDECIDEVDAETVTPYMKSLKTLETYNEMIRQFSKDILVVEVQYAQLKKTKRIMLDLVRRPVIIGEINKVIQKVLDKNGNMRTIFKKHLSPYQLRLIMVGNIEKETLEIQEELLTSLKNILKV